MSIASELTRLQNAKASIKYAIEQALGEEIPSEVTLSEYPAYISSAAQIQYALGVATGAGGGEVMPVGSNSASSTSESFGPSNSESNNSNA